MTLRLYLAAALTASCAASHRPQVAGEADHPARDRSTDQTHTEERSALESERHPSAMATTDDPLLASWTGPFGGVPPYGKFRVADSSRPEAKPPCFDALNVMIRSVSFSSGSSCCSLNR